MKRLKAISIASIVVMAAIAAAVMTSNQAILIPEGCVGVQEKNGVTGPDELYPWHPYLVSRSSNVFLYCTLTQEHKMRVNTKTRENATSIMEIGIVYNLDGNKASGLHEDYGSSGNFDGVFEETIGTAWQDAARNMSLEDFLSTEKQQTETTATNSAENDTRLKAYGLNVKGVHLRGIKPRNSVAENILNRPTGDFSF